MSARSRRKSRVSFAPTDLTSLMTDEDFEQFLVASEGGANAMASIPEERQSSAANR